MFRKAQFFMMVILLAGIASGAVMVNAQEDDYAPDIDPANFVSGIDNPFLPFTPGTTLVYEGISDGEAERIVVEVTDDTREVMGVETVVVRDTVWVDGDLVEDTYDWFAQDNEGNVWYFGEEVKDYENGEVVSTEGSWEAGVDGALPGIVMWAAPEVGAVYRQEYYVGEAEDMAEVIALDASETLAYGSFDGLLVTREWNPFEPGVTENKYYAEGIGLILEVKVEGGEARIELINITTDDDMDDEDGDDDCEVEDGDDDDEEDDDEGEDGEDDGKNDDEDEDC